MKITSVLNIKGGTGKTLTTEIIGRSYAKLGRKTLLVDTDGQGSLSNQMIPNVNFAECGRTITEVLKGTKDIQECIWETGIENLYLLPANMELFVTIYQLQGKGGSDFTLLKKLQELDFDEVVIDNNPSVTKMTYNAIYASDEIICPTDLGIKALEGVQHTREVILQSIEELPFSKPIKFSLLLTKVTRNKNNKKWSQELREVFGDEVLKTEIRFQQKPVQDAESSDKSLLDFTQGVSEDYKAMFEELLEREGR